MGNIFEDASKVFAKDVGKMFQGPHSFTSKKAITKRIAETEDYKIPDIREMSSTEYAGLIKNPDGWEEKHKKTIKNMEGKGYKLRGSSPLGSIWEKNGKRTKVSYDSKVENTRKELTRVEKIKQMEAITRKTIKQMVEEGRSSEQIARFSASQAEVMAMVKDAKTKDSDINNIKSLKLKREAKDSKINNENPKQIIEKIKRKHPQLTFFSTYKEYGEWKFIFRDKSGNAFHFDNDMKCKEKVKDSIEYEILSKSSNNNWGKVVATAKTFSEAKTKRDAFVKEARFNKSDLKIQKVSDSNETETFKIEVHLKQGKPFIENVYARNVDEAKQIIKDKYKGNWSFIKVRDSKTKDADSIQSLVDKVIKIYMEEDYDYVVTMTKRGTKIAKSTISDEIDWLKRHKFDVGLSNADLKEAAKRIADRINEINRGIKVSK